MIITIDGPAGAGKSSISKQFAQHIKYSFLDTGAMYRCVALITLRSQLPISELKQEVQKIDIHFEQQYIFLNGENVSQLIRTPEIDILTSQISQDPFVREHMSILQRTIAHKQNTVAEGRDMGSHVFPEAFIKFYLTASVEIRAQRRLKQLTEQGISSDYQKLIEEITLRDYQDSHRELNPLCIPENAVIIDTSDFGIHEVLQKMITIFNEKKDS